MEIFPEHVRHLWNEWELRTLVLISLTWQVILIRHGSRRKHARCSFVSFLVWVTYLSADWLATVSLGTLANDQGDQCKQDSNHALQALWAPFLLLHLGGPDTITAYALEDNILWIRHLLGLLVQVSVAFYIYIRSWNTSALTFIAIPVFVSGIIKYAERTWVLRSASPEQLEESLLSAPAIQAPDLDRSYGNPELEYVHRGYYLFPVLRRLYANLSLRFAESQRTYKLMVKKEHVDDEEKQSNYAFKLVEVQLGFLYDLLYTKATTIYTLPGLIFRFISVLSTLSALASCVVFLNVHEHEYSGVDISITYCLFIGAILLELYALVSLLFSDWTLNWLVNKQSSLQNFICRALSRCQKRWSGELAQHNLLNFCIKKRVTRCLGNDFLFRIYFPMELYWQRTWEDVDTDLKQIIFILLKRNQREYGLKRFDYNFLKDLLSYKGDHALRFHGEIMWSVEVEFGHSILIWHIATDICYHSTKAAEYQKKKWEASKRISNYMLYLLLMHPFMLPKWINRITHIRNTFREAIRILQREQLSVKDAASASKLLIQMNTQSHRPLEQLRREKAGKSLLHEGCRLALQLQNIYSPCDIICDVWLEMLTYAASQCDWGAHAQQLRRGGEFLTHVCLLMAELGLSKQFDIGRKESSVESQDDGWGCLKSRFLSSYK
ncbi:hypothetical protein HN51_023096 [Arachis hypogaea]|uniref:DUF4220 domain-containing protein n=2 Tax=Arachis hypogaea TaxID=3818 RepID=A0A445E6H5_ARAHY|nr:uncharacterized protein LOC112728750 [Arachis hypogaea]QHO54485.1 uncharacterized protein DS421_2g57200 [Arachis hypogaea]RYR71062.1 hypothetical protein Ahy_A02g005356 isoform A [Arachis hypogaea]